MSATKGTLISLLVLALVTGGCRPGAQAVKVGRLTVVSEPVDGADIYINNRKQTLKTNAFFNLRPGVYTISLFKAGNGGDETRTGEAKITVKAGRAARAVIALNKMKIVPAAQTKSLRAETQAQATLLNYYTALEAKDFQAAFSHLNRRGKLAQGGFWRFSRTAKQIAAIKVEGLTLESFDPTTSVEVNRVALEITKVPPPKGPAPQAERVEVMITTVDEVAGIGLPKIESIVETSATL